MSTFDIKKQRETQAELATEARKELDSITEKTSESEAKEIEARFDARMADHDAIDARLVREAKIADAEKRAVEARRPVAGDSVDAGVELIPAEYREVFAKVICGQRSELNADELQVLKRGASDFRTQTGGSNTAGGFTVPTTLKDEIVKSMLAFGPMYSEDIATVFTTSSGNPMKIPTVNDTLSVAAAHAEGQPVVDNSTKDVTFGQKSLDAYAFDTDFIRWSWELDMDSIFSMEQLLAALLGERLGRIANNRLTVGTGTNEPNGIVSASTQGVLSNSDAAITFDEILDLEHSVDPAYRGSPKCRYMFNDQTLLAVRKLKDGDGNYLWQQGNVVNGAPSSFNGRPYSINQSMAGIEANKLPMVFGDFSKYYVRKVGAPVIGVMTERFWPDMGVAGLIRFDGELGDTAAVKHLAMSA